MEYDDEQYQQQQKNLVLSAKESSKLGEQKHWGSKIKTKNDKKNKELHIK